LEPYLAALEDGAVGHDAQHGSGERRLAAARFAHHTEDSPARQLQFHMIEDLRETFVGSDRQTQILHRQQWIATHRDRLSRGSTMSLRPSPRRLNPSTVTKMASPGNVENHQASGRYCRLSAMANPQSGSGGVAPMPRKPNTAATKIVKPMPIVARTMTGEIELGRICRNRMRAAPAPMHWSASMNSETLSRRASP